MTKNRVLKWSIETKFAWTFCYDLRLATRWVAFLQRLKNDSSDVDFSLTLKITNILKCKNTQSCHTER